MLVRDVLISEMQKRGNEILIEVNGAAESFFFAAQRYLSNFTLNYYSIFVYIVGYCKT